MMLSPRPLDAAEGAHALAAAVRLLVEAVRELAGGLAITGPWHALAQAEDLAAHAAACVELLADPRTPAHAGDAPRAFDNSHRLLLLPATDPPRKSS